MIYEDPMDAKNVLLEISCNLKLTTNYSFNFSLTYFELIC